MNMQKAVEQLKDYKQLQARMQVLSNYSIGSGITLSRLNGDDQLQDLHRRLRGLPSYMYLSAREQRLETTAHAYLKQYPAGIKSQLKAIPEYGADAEDDKILQELRNKIKKVIDARGYGVRDDLDAVLERLSELQDIQDEIKRIDTVLEALQRYKPEYERLIRLQYIEGTTVSRAAIKLCVTERTFRRWRDRALQEYLKLSV
ncbi:ECF sigma factor [Paenibacillus algorifonticola]|uniref:ECF sigma factor n=1 Tax=Paenibacillus algorifonticola TaxID=684063 RepID=A0A1I1XV71_9BACL|nr:ECF-type sigma factor [Paenibacillus algorifonticola]SFE11226.1 ECF sigma factor [Paenibacillus algorifonticola]